MPTPLPPPERRETAAARLREAARLLDAHGIDSPRSTAEILLAFVLGLPRGELYRHLGRTLSPQEEDAFQRLVERRLRREPTAYLTGRRGFWTLDLEVTPEVLIPRPETERLVEAALEVIGRAPAGRTLRVLDLGCGSGAVVVALACEAPRHRYFASDRSAAAVRIARRNAAAHGCGARIRFFVADWAAALRAGAAPFDLIVSNPPYIPRAQIERLAPEIARFEPRAALDGGEDGLEAYRAILGGAWPLLARGGALLCEIGHDQRAALEGLIAAARLPAAVECLRDLSGRERVLRVVKKELASSPIH